MDDRKIVAILMVAAVLAVVVGFGTRNVLGTNTTVTVVSPMPNIENGDIFEVKIRCSPTVPVKAWEVMRLNYDPTKLEAMSVTEGNLFQGYTTFFNSGTINNTGGYIKHMYNLIVGQGMVTATGDMVTITFKALQSGTTYVTLSDVGVTNATAYLPITVSNLTLVISSQYDMNGDGTVDMQDLLSVALHFGASGTPGWIIQDVREDGKINILDLLMIVLNWGPY